MACTEEYNLNSHSASLSAKLRSKDDCHATLRAFEYHARGRVVVFIGEWLFGNITPTHSIPVIFHTGIFDYLAMTFCPNLD
jgi:hypothetical protein